MSDQHEPFTKPRLAVVKNKCCGECRNFRPGEHSDAAGACLELIYAPERYPNQVCHLFEAK